MYIAGRPQTRLKSGDPVFDPLIVDLGDGCRIFLVAVELSFVRRHRGHAPHRKIHGTGDSANFVSPMVQRFRVRDLRGIRDLHHGTQRDLAKFSRAVRVLGHHPERLVPVIRDCDSSLRAKVENPKHMTSGERAHQQLLGVVPRRISAENRIGRTRNRRLLARSGKFMIAPIRAILLQSLLGM